MVFNLGNFPVFANEKTQVNFPGKIEEPKRTRTIYPTEKLTIPKGFPLFSKMSSKHACFKTVKARKTKKQPVLSSIDKTSKAAAARSQKAKDTSKPLKKQPGTMTVRGRCVKIPKEDATIDISARKLTGEQWFAYFSDPEKEEIWFNADGWCVDEEYFNSTPMFVHEFVHRMDNCSREMTFPHFGKDLWKSVSDRNSAIQKKLSDLIRTLPTDSDRLILFDTFGPVV